MSRRKVRAEKEYGGGVDGAGGKYVLRLYIAGTTPRSTRATGNLC